jgi:hypothetical protein
MADKASNILFEYLYRDASNWKQHGQAVFTNTTEIPLANIEARIHASLEDGEWFIAEMVDLETCFIGDHDTEDDHPWHEFERISESGFASCDPSFCAPCRDIAQLLQALENGKLRQWDPERQLCCICGQPFTEDEWENRHDLHEPDCPRARTKGRQTFGEIFCYCNLVAHARCCPECNKSESEAEAEILPG